MQEIQIQPRDVYEHFIYVQRPGTTLRWTFTTRKKNIYFGLFFRAGPPMATTSTPGNHRSSKSPAPISEHRYSITSLSSTRTMDTYNTDSDWQHYNICEPSSNKPGVDINKGKRGSLTQVALHQQQRKHSTASAHLIENQFQQVIPIAHTHSSEEQIHGSYTVSEPGNCVLIFDNTTSINTSKILRFSVTSDESIQDVTAKSNGSQEMTGYLLKKRRKRMQGWAKRWFELLPGGALSYCVSPGGIKRGSIQITMTMITIYPKQRTIHLDTGTTVYHLKALTKQDFDKWVDEFRRQRAISHRDQNDGIMVDGAWLLPDSRYRLTPGSSTSQRQTHPLNPIDSDPYDDEEDDILGDGQEIEDHEQNQTHLENDLKQMSFDLDHLSLSLQQLKKSSYVGGYLDTTSNNAPTTSPTISPSAANSKRRFIFRRGSSQSTVTHALNTNLPASSNQSQNDQSDPPSSPTSTNSITTLDNMMEVLQRIIDTRNHMEMEYNKQQRYWTRVKERHLNGSPLHHHTQQQGSEFGTPRSLSFYSYHSSNHSDLYYDAEEFELALDEDDDADLVQENYDLDDSSSVEDELSDLPINDDSSLISTSTTIKPQLQPPSPIPGFSTSVIKRRTILPHPVAGKNVNLLSLLRKNIGKDLSTITMPISLNEPLNLLQRLCEELEYSSLLDKANTLDDSLDRLMYVATFAISGYASSQYRIGRKFWNPLLFETYECLRPDKGFRFISEKVSHRPNIMACHAESRNFTFWQSTEGSTKFWGKSMEFISEGTVNVKLPKHGDNFTYTKPSSHMRNMIFGTRYLEHLGQIKVTNHTTGEYAVVAFKEARRNGNDSYYFGGGGGQWERNEVEITFYTNCSSAHGRKVIGKWSESVSQDLGDQQYKLLWKAQPPTVDRPMDYYGFTQFCMELNEITALEKDHLPPTDTRLRPDQRLFEEGVVDQAELEKERVEVMQRERRSQNEESGITPTPMWFRRNPNDSSQWEYKGGYWETRSNGTWPDDIPTLW
ncbi:Oxysterol-binding protein-domain-containing protein [Chlamydoabsidia padenii]|nr:Oxysterol-binding protein-domain-containing protein [Chlamydoabsidia padenii]